LSKIRSEATKTHSLSATTKSEDNPTNSSATSTTSAVLIDDIDVILDPDMKFLPPLKTVVQTTKVPLFLTLIVDDESPTQNERSLEGVKTLISDKYPFLAGFIIISFYLPHLFYLL